MKSLLWHGLKSERDCLFQIIETPAREEWINMVEETLDS